jgi:FkbM family methyltransferase
MGVPPVSKAGVRAEPIEYFALLDALEHAKSSFTVVELGASFAPWSCTAAVLAKRLGLDFQITAVEAAKFTFDLIPRHFAENGIDPTAANVRLINAAIAISRYLPLYFPKASSAGKLGSSASLQNDGERELVAACELSDVVPKTGCDLLHIDIQGAEAELIGAGRQLLKERVRALFIGTHSRRVDCDLYAMLSDDKWVLVRERQCRPGMRNGGQYWRNPAPGILPTFVPQGRFFMSHGYLPPMRSYAQNFEDVTLRRALQDIKQGFYVDVGAAWERYDSVTRWFYEQGWRGINAEPNPALLGVFQQERPRDINVGIAISDGVQREAALYVVGDNTGLTTTDHHLVRAGNLPVTRTVTVPSMSLDQLLQKHEPLPTIDFLKIDAEGCEVPIIQAASFAKYRPRVILIETNGFELFDPLLRGKGYSFVWFDGINAFYVRQEDAWRGDLIARPPSVWDCATTSALMPQQPSGRLRRYLTRSAGAVLSIFD